MADEIDLCDGSRLTALCSISKCVKDEIITRYRELSPSARAIYIRMIVRGDAILESVPTVKVQTNG